MSRAQELALKLVAGGALAGGTVAFCLFMFSCIGADAGMVEFVLSMGVGVCITLMSCIPFMLATLAKMALQR